MAVETAQKAGAVREPETYLTQLDTRAALRLS